jgi:hypothetical protein
LLESAEVALVTRQPNVTDLESSAVMAMEYLVSEVKYLVKSGFERLKVMVKVERKERSLNSRCPMAMKD